MCLQYACMETRTEGSHVAGLLWPTVSEGSRVKPGRRGLRRGTPSGVCVAHSTHSAEPPGPASHSCGRKRHLLDLSGFVELMRLDKPAGA